jgi:hypothetical protein
LKAICLTYDRHHQVMDFVIRSYERLWPQNPFVYHVPYNEVFPAEMKDRYGDKIVLLRTPRPIRETIEALTATLDDED